MSTVNKLLVQQMVEVVQNQHHLARMHDFFTPDFINHLDHAPDSPQDSIEKAQQVFTQLFTAFPDLHVTIQHQVAEDDLVMTHKTFTGTHRGTFMGMAPTDRQIAFTVIDILRIQAGKIVEHWAVQDRLGLMQQLQ